MQYKTKHLDLKSLCQNVNVFPCLQKWPNIDFALTLKVILFTEATKCISESDVVGVQNNFMVSRTWIFQILASYMGNQIKGMTRLRFSTKSYLFALHAYAFLGRTIPSTWTGQYYRGEAISPKVFWQKNSEILAHSAIWGKKINFIVEKNEKTHRRLKWRHMSNNFLIL
jgi:hypothetical protein